MGGGGSATTRRAGGETGGGGGSKAQMGAKRGQGNRCPQFHLSVQATPTLAAILHFSSK